MLDHAPGFFRSQVQPVFPQVAVFQAAVFRQFFLIRHQRKQPRVAACQTFPRVQNAVVHAFDVGTEVDRIAQECGVVGFRAGRIDAQQRVAKHRRGTVEVRGRENQHRAVRRHILVPGFEFLAVRGWQVSQVQLVAQPAGTCRVYALGVGLLIGHGGVNRLQRGAELCLRVMRTVGGEKEFRVCDVAAPATELAGLVVTQGNPERLIGQLLQTVSAGMR